MSNGRCFRIYLLYGLSYSVQQMDALVAPFHAHLLFLKFVFLSRLAIPPSAEYQKYCYVHQEMCQSTAHLPNALVIFVLKNSLRHFVFLSSSGILENFPQQKVVF